MFDENDGWQEHLQSVIDRILLKTRLDDNVAVGAMVLLEAFQQICHLSPAYPNDVYIRYFLGAYISAHRQFSMFPIRKGFWKDVVGGSYSDQNLEQTEQNFSTMLSDRIRFTCLEFEDMKRRMYALIRTYMMLRSGETYDQDCIAKSGGLPPCHAEMV